MEAALAVLAVLTVASLALAVRSQQRARQAQQQLSRLANFDPLTGLPNRAQLNRWLDDLLVESRRSTKRVAVIFVELLRFDYLNETYGHEVGDALMVAAVGAIRAASRPEDLLVRFSGPQFVLAVPDTTDPKQATQRATQVLDAVQHAYEIGADRIRLSASAGVALTDQQYTDADDVLFDAGIALQRAVEAGSGTITLFDSSMRSLISPSTAEHRLRSALDRGEFWLLYLPVVSLTDNSLQGVEALLRWADPEVGVVSPSQFMRSLDETGLILPVGAWVVQEACRQAKEWSDRFTDRTISVTVNVSPRQVLQSDFGDIVLAALEETRAAPESLTLEMTEGALLRDVETVWTTLRQLKSAGVQVALDDFGTGHSSLAYLRRFQLDNLKVDRTFVENIATSREDAAIVQQIIGLAHALGMRAIAEGVETAEQVDTLRSLGVDGAQGFYFSTPQPADVIDRFLAKGRIDRTDRPLALEDVRARATIVRPRFN